MRRSPATILLGAVAAVAVVSTGYQLLDRARAEPPQAQARATEVLHGRAAYTDTRQDRPGLRRHITVADLPAPRETPSTAMFPRTIPRPENAWPQAPAGFTVQLYAGGFQTPRKMITAPNGDVFLAESGGGSMGAIPFGVSATRATRGVRPEGIELRYDV
jgi:hypothetical protein